MSKTTSVYNEEGKLQMLISYNPSCSCRTYTEFYPDGKVFAKRVFKVVDKGEYIDGEDVTYYHDGSVKQYKLWKNAIPDGRAYVNYENGKLEHEEFYSARYKTGIWKFYDKNGGLIREYQFEDNRNKWDSKKDSYTARYFDKGKLLYTEVFAAGKLAKADKKEIKPAETKKVVAVNKNADILDGKKLFALKCAVCHAFDKDGYGPALGGVARRRSSIWLYKMITDGMKLVEEGDKDALAIYNRYNKKKHPNTDYLSNKQVEAIINYMKKPD